MDKHHVIYHKHDIFIWIPPLVATWPPWISLQISGPAFILAEQMGKAENPNPMGDLQNPETEVRKRKYHLFGHIFGVSSQKHPRNIPEI